MLVMETVLVKIFATALALSQVATTPENVQTRFDRVADQAIVVQLLRAGCAHMRKAFDIEAINLDELIATAMEDPQAITSQSKVFHGINFADLQTAYRQFCNNESVAVPERTSKSARRHYDCFANSVDGQVAGPPKQPFRPVSIQPGSS